MSPYKETRWGEKDFGKIYLDTAKAFVPDRERLIEMARSYYKEFVTTKKEARAILELGPGDGAFTRGLLDADPNLKATLIDASPEMINAARETLSGTGAEFIISSFEELIENDPLAGREFDFVVSSLAIHHMSTESKPAFYKYIFDHLRPGGAFFNIDAVKSPCEEIEDWYLKLWGGWIDAQDEKPHPDGPFAKKHREIKNKPGNHTDPLFEQIAILKETGFIGADCFYKYGRFAAFGGRKKD